MTSPLATLTARITIAMIGLTAMTALAVAWWTDRQVTAAALPGQLHRVENHAQLLASKLDLYVRAASDDVRALASSPLARDVALGYLEPADPAHERERALLRGHFRAVAENKPYILQLRLIAADQVGREWVRVDRSGPAGAVRITPDRELQDKGGRDYARVGRTLGEGQVHVTRLEPNWEHGQVERPLRPVVRAVAPVWDSRRGQALALVVINVDMGPLLASLDSALYARSQVFVVDSHGDYARHATDPGLVFASVLGSEGRDWRDDFKGLAVDRGERTQKLHAPDGTRLCVSMVRTSLEPGVRIVETIPCDDLVSFTAGTTQATVSVTAIVLIGSLLLGIVVSLSLIRPLRQLTRAVENFSTSDLAKSPLPRRGEFGVLATTLERLAVQVAQRTSSLEREIAAHEHTLAELRQAEERMRLVVESSPNGICVVDKHGVLLMVNHAVEQFFGYERDELLGHSVDMLLPEGGRMEHGALRDSFMAAPANRPMGAGRDLFAQRKNGELLAVEIGLCPLTLQGRETVLASIVDITERRAQHLQLSAYATKLEQNNAELEKLAYVVSHDIKTPLRGIATVAQWIEADFGPVVDADARENLTLMLERIERLEQLLGGILDYSRAGRGHPSQTDVDAEVLVRDVIASLVPSPHIEIRVAGPLPRIRYNETQLRQVFQNLLDNAIKHLGKPQGTIAVSCDEEPDRWRFSVKDDGVGIPERHFERIFDLFQTLRPKDEVKSVGAGLAIVQRIVESNGGEISVASTEGEGARFCFTVPKSGC